LAVRGGFAFRSEGKTPVVGVCCTFGRWEGQFAIGKIEAIFDRKTPSKDRFWPVPAMRW
jgi:hypothetical protein